MSDIQDVSLTRAGVGTVVEYVDEFAVSHLALVTRQWADDDAFGKTASINLVHVTGNPAETDQYGRQTKHVTSVVPEPQQSAHGRFYRVR